MLNKNKLKNELISWLPSSDLFFPKLQEKLDQLDIDGKKETAKLFLELLEDDDDEYSDVNIILDHIRWYIPTDILLEFFWNNKKYFKNKMKNIAKKFLGFRENTLTCWDHYFEDLAKNKPEKLFELASSSTSPLEISHILKNLSLNYKDIDTKYINLFFDILEKFRGKTSEQDILVRKVLVQCLGTIASCQNPSLKVKKQIKSKLEEYLDPQVEPSLLVRHEARVDLIFWGS